MNKTGGYVYIITNKPNGTLYIGSTSDLIGRVFEHKNKIILKCFTARYNLDKLVYFEWHNKLENMVQRERQLKE
jgi:putative endonuclease